MRKLRVVVGIGACLACRRIAASSVPGLPWFFFLLSFYIICIVRVIIHFSHHHPRRISATQALRCFPPPVYIVSLHLKNNNRPVWSSVFCSIYFLTFHLFFIIQMARVVLFILYTSRLFRRISWTR